MYEIEIFTHAGGKGFRILSDGTPCIVQPFDPDEPGDTPMTQARAQAAAEAVVARMVGEEGA